MVGRQRGRHAGKKIFSIAKKLECEKIFLNRECKELILNNEAKNILMGC
jgi:hypothetical protein